ncbi:MAG: MarR family transcriptional regulator [Lachnospiraceae bacterium]|nr:MarR family transcriptional regulator [Lachnospiraceae bacterium]
MTEEKIKEQSETFCASWHTLDVLYEEYAKSKDLSYTSLRILNYIYSGTQRYTQKELAQMAFLPKQTVNSIITGFYRQGLVVMKELEEDRRTKAVYLTEKGKVYAEEILPKIHEAEYSAIGQMNPDERILFLELMHRYVMCCSEVLTDKERR